MKKITLFIAAIMLLCIAACGQKEESGFLTEVKDIEVPAFSIIIGGTKISEKDMVGCKLYSAKTETVNSQGNSRNYVYVGYKFSDVLKAAKVEGSVNSAKIICTDGYEMKYEGDLNAEGVLLAITKDGEAFKSGPWFAPCISKTTGDYAQDLAEVELADKEALTTAATDEPSSPDTEGEMILAFPQDPVCEDKTEKIKFNDFSFKINDKVVTNKDLEGLKIFRITVTTKNSKEIVSQSKYSGYILKDVLTKLGISAAKVTAIADDGYESELTGEQLASELTIIAIEKDKETGKNGTVWVAPCSESTSGAYAKGVVEIKAE